MTLHFKMGALDLPTYINGGFGSSGGSEIDVSGCSQVSATCKFTVAGGVTHQLGLYGCDIEGDADTANVALEPVVVLGAATIVSKRAQLVAAGAGTYYLTAVWKNLPKRAILKTTTVSGGGGGDTQVVALLAW